MNLQNSPINWFDLVVVIVLLLGIRQGRKNGMSVEMMPMLQWMAIVLGGAFLYRPLGDMLATTTPMGHLFCYISVYVITAIVIKGIFALIKKSAGGKLLGSDLFGRGEFYLGMFGGAVRFACILLAAMALLNAPYYSSQQVASSKAYQVDMYGSQFFPGLSGAQQDIFEGSMIGSMVKHQAEFLLIATTKPEHKELKRRKDELP